MSTPSTPSSNHSSISSAAAPGSMTPPAHSYPSPVMNLFRLFTPSSSSATPSPSLHPQSTPLGPIRTVSDPTVFQLGSPVLAATQATPAQKLKLQRAKSLESGEFRLPDAATSAIPPLSHASSVPTSPALGTHSRRTFSVQSGFPAAEAQRKNSNGFLELLCKQDSFMGAD